MAQLDELDRQLLVHLQENFPLSLRPFRKLGERLSLSEEKVIARVKRLKIKGIIKRIGPIYNSERIGYKRTLVAMSVPRERLEEVAAVVNRFSEVTHNYQRADRRFNLWFTLICPSSKRISAILRKIRQGTAIKEIINLPTLKTVKIKAVFKP
jgi:DNA-binding Lrp family transcriptional regulator